MQTIVSFFISAAMNKHAFLTELIDAWNAHDRDRLLAMYHPDYLGEDLSEGKQADGLANAGRMIDYIFNALPDLHMQILEEGAEGNQVFFFWKATGHHKGRLMNIPPTGKAVAFMGSTFFTLRDGKIIRSRRIWDVAGMLRQIGLLPEPTSAQYF
ncbi:MAG: ester cyclase [Saprospiraceae bacterium]|nr:ester cyclase [Saprospiraceae bacterium]